MSEQESAALYHWLTFTWVSPLLSRGWMRRANGAELQLSDLIRLPRFEQPEVNLDMLRGAWQAELKNHQPSLSRALCRAFWRRTAVGGVLRLTSDGFAFASPFLLQELLRWLQSEADDRVWEGFIWVVTITLSNLFMSWSLNFSSHHSLTSFTQMCNALQLAIYDKILLQHPDHGETGHLTSLHAGDAQRLMVLAPTFHSVWISPILVIAAAAALFHFMGYAGLIAVGTMIVFSPVQAILMRKLMGYRVQIVRNADRRVHTINEVLQGIRICKFMNWEANFEARIRNIREEEVQVLRHSHFMRAFVTMIGTAVPSVVQFTLFAVSYALEGDIQPQKVFPAIAMLNVIRIPMIMFPMAVAMLLETRVSITRMQNFLLRSDIEVYVTQQPFEQGVSMANVTVTSRDTKTVILKEITCAFPAGQLSLLHGPTGCGKSTLVKALIGEATVDKCTLGHVRIGGSLAYMAQEAWIMNATVRENIIMDMPYDTTRYWRVVKACQLSDDLAQLTQGDMTEIGERGVNLSGGQKQRIAFARAAYSDKKVIVMDDPLSAVDAHVCKRLFEECICGFMRGKTRILVTHQIQFINKCDFVVELGDRCIVKSAAPDHKIAVDVCAATAETCEVTTEGGETTALMTKENVVVGEVSWGVYAWFLRLGTIQLASLTFFAYLIWRTSTLFADLWVAWWSVNTRAFGRDYTNIEYLQYFGITVGISIVLVYCRQITFAVFSVTSSRQSHAAMTSRVLRAPTSFFDTTPMGRILNRFTKDMDGLDTRIPDALASILMTGFNLLGMLVMVAVTSPYILVIFPFLGIVLRFVYVRYTATVRSIKQLEAVTRPPVFAVVNETLGGLSTIRAFKMVTHFRDKHVRRAHLAARPVYNTRCAQRWLSSRTELIGTVILFVASYVAALAHVAQEPGSDGVVSVSSAVIGLSLTYVISTTNAVTFLNRTLAEFEAEMSCTERIMEYSTRIPQERDVVYDDTKPPPPNKWGTNGALKFNNVGLRYRDDLPLVLKNVSFSVENSQKVGIVGRTGSGKSTVILAVFRMLELESGSISLDTRDIADISLLDLRSRITIIPQDPVLFAGTIRSNLDPFGTHTDADIWDALTKSNIYDRIAAEGGGLDCTVTERGGNFSVGERQLLCLARAILKKCSILLLDEATASVDFSADQLIQHTIRTVFKNCTVITVAHRLATIIDADKIIVLRDGQVAEDGTPRALLEQRGLFHDMIHQLGASECQRLTAIANSTTSTS